MGDGAGDGTGYPQGDGSPDGLPAVVRRINAAHGTPFRLVGRYSLGEQGAFRLLDAADGRFVLKWAPGAAGLGRLPHIVAALDRLRASGYPAPRYAVFGATYGPPAGRYAVLEALPGAPLGTVNGAVLERLLALNDLQTGLGSAVDPAGAGSASIPIGRSGPARDVLGGGAGYCLLAPMRAYSPATAVLLTTLQDLVAAHSALRVPGGRPGALRLRRAQHPRRGGSDHRGRRLGRGAGRGPHLRPRRAPPLVLRPRHPRGAGAVVGPCRRADRASYGKRLPCAPAPSAGGMVRPAPRPPHRRRLAAPRRSRPRGHRVPYRVRRACPGR